MSATSGLAIVGAHVRVRELGRSDASHADGSFHLGNLSAGAYTVTAQRIGHAPAEVPVLVRSGALARGNLSFDDRPHRGRNFIHDSPTGLVDPRFRRFPLYVAAGSDAEYRESGNPLPSMPPLSGRVGVHEPARYFVTGGWDGTGAQRRVSTP